MAPIFGDVPVVDVDKAFQAVTGESPHVHFAGSMCELHPEGFLAVLREDEAWMERCDFLSDVAIPIIGMGADDDSLQCDVMNVPFAAGEGEACAASLLLDPERFMPLGQSFVEAALAPEIGNAQGFWYWLRMSVIVVRDEEDRQKRRRLVSGDAVLLASSVSRGRLARFEGRLLGGELLDRAQRILQWHALRMQLGDAPQVPPPADRWLQRMDERARRSLPGELYHEWQGAA